MGGGKKKQSKLGFLMVLFYCSVADGDRGNSCGVSECKQQDDGEGGGGDGAVCGGECGDRHGGCGGGGAAICCLFVARVFRVALSPLLRTVRYNNTRDNCQKSLPTTTYCQRKRNVSP